MPRLKLAALIAALGMCVVGTMGAAAAPAYRVISQDPAGDGIRVTVRLDARQTAADLKVIADDVRDRLPPDKIVNSVAFYLASSALTGKPWADVKLAPDAAVAIFGLRLEEENAYRAEASKDTRKRIGVWLTSPPALAGVLTLYRDGKGKAFAEWKLRSGQTTTDEVYESKANGGRRYDIAGADGGYYRLDGKGGLELGNARSVIAVAEPLRLSPPKPAAASPPAVVAGQVGAPQTAAAPAHAVADVKAPVPNAPGVTTSASKVPEVTAAAAAAAKPARKRSVAMRPRAAERLARQADAAGDAIKRALAQ